MLVQQSHPVRDHRTKNFPFCSGLGESEAEVLLYGTVECGFKEGGSGGKDWAARALPVKNGSSEGELGGWEMKFYRVYMVSCRDC